MIKIQDVLSWLTLFQPTHLRRTTLALVKHITDINTPEDKRKQMISSAISHSRTNVDRLELPELLLNIAEVKFRLQEFTSARDYANAAVQLYPADSHMVAIARWMLGIISWRLQDAKLAYSSWYYTREIVMKRIDLAKKQDRKVEIRWYQEFLVKIQVDLVCTPEETYTWLDIFEPSHLSNAAQQINITITEKLDNNQFQDVYKLIQDMQTLGRSSNDFLENAEILVECGLAVYRMGNLKEAFHLLQKAVDAFTPESHHQAVARWLLGILQWESPEKHSQAIMNWEKCLGNFDLLAHKADQENMQTRKEWYQNKRKIMATALHEMISDRLG